MILIKEDITKKCPGETSLFISFSYKEEYINILKKCSGSSYNKKDKIWEVPVSYLSLLLDEFCIYDSIKLELLDHREPVLPKVDLDFNKFKVLPFTHQQEAIEYGLAHDKWLLLDPPGLGKTLSILYLAQELREKGEIEHCLIICGINTLKTNWKREIQKFTDLSCRILGEKVTKKGNIVIGSISERIAQLKAPIDEFYVITNIETLRNPEVANAILKGPNKFDMICVDEIHACKSPSTQQGQGLLKLNKSKYRIGATGTLIVSKPLDAYVPLKWLGIERGTYTNYKYYYCTFGGPFNNILCGFKNMDILKDIINKHSLRRPKSLLNLPPKIEIDEVLEMEDAQSKFYENIKNGIRDQVDKVKLNTSSLLALIGRLRQATSCPSILTTEDIKSVKVERACDLVDQIVSNGEKVVIFSSFKETTNILNQQLSEYRPLVCTGDTPDAIVSQNIDIFQTDPGRSVFIATWQKMGTGITLTSASNVIFIDSPYTYAQKEQAEDRCYRIGTKSTVMIYNLITANTVDERVAEIVKNKEALGDYLIDGEVSNTQLKILQKYIEEL